MAIRCEAFVVTVSIWELYERCSSTMIPRSLTLLQYDKCSPLIEYSGCGHDMLRECMRVQRHLLALTVNCHCSDHSWILSRTIWRSWELTDNAQVMLLYNFKSSANSCKLTVSHETKSVMSLTYNINSIRP